MLGLIKYSEHFLDLMEFPGFPKIPGIARKSLLDFPGFFEEFPESPGSPRTYPKKYRDFLGIPGIPGISYFFTAGRLDPGNPARGFF